MEKIKRNETVHPYVTRRRAAAGRREKRDENQRESVPLSAVLSFAFSPEPFPMKIIQLRAGRYLGSLGSQGPGDVGPEEFNYFERREGPRHRKLV